MLKRNWLLLSIIFIVLLGLILISGCRDSRTRVPGPGEDNVDPDITVTLVGTDIMVGGSEVDDIIKMDSDNSGII
jgi:predicted small secreted protein